jgi:hypothetical protein
MFLFCHNCCNVANRGDVEVVPVNDLFRRNEHLPRIQIRVGGHPLVPAA